MFGRRTEFWELQGWQRTVFLVLVCVAGVYGVWMGAFSDGGGTGCRWLREAWQYDNQVPAEVHADPESRASIRTFGVHCREAATGEAPDCSVTWTVDGRVHQRHCGPLDQSSIEDWL
ncbi:MAG: hypothetical protein R3B99_29850 [Polyangiales bacterium]